jgi:hypothetical protein
MTGRITVFAGSDMRAEPGARRAVMSVPRLAAIAFVATAALLGTGCGRADQRSAPVSSSPAELSLSEFAAAADAACIRSAVKVNALQDPDGVGGKKQLGLGLVVITWADELAAIHPPEELAARWTTATELLRRSGVRLQDAEELAAAGDLEGSGAAQSEALWSLQPEAAEIIAGLAAPFEVCFVE